MAIAVYGLHFSFVFLFVVLDGKKEWPENREEQGDTAIYNEYLDFGVPKNQCCYIKDDDCTRKNCQQSLKNFLKRTNCIQKHAEEQQPPKTLVFYYGGHGCANGFSTIGGTWAHQDIVRTIDKHFQGDRVLFLVDCCSAGSLWRHFPSESEATKEYVLLATSQPYIVTSSEGEEWILSNTWIQIMRRVCCDENGEYSNYLGLDETISILADRTVFELGDLFFAYRTPSTEASRNERWSWLPAWDGGDKKTSVEPLSWLKTATESGTGSYQMPDEAQISSVFDCRVGDGIAYKHPGGRPTSIASSTSENKELSFNVPPLWLNGTIIAVFENDRGEDSTENDNGRYSSIFFRIRVSYPSQIEPWEIEISHCSPRLINHLFVAQHWMLPKSFLETQVVLAQKYNQYLDCSLTANTPVRVALKDMDNGGPDTVLEGTILDWKDFNWKQLLHSCTGVSHVTTEYDDFYWNELPIPIKRAAKILGYTKHSWNKDTGIPADKMSHDELSRAQKDAAAVLGYARSASLVCLPHKPNSSSGLGSRTGISAWTNVAEISTGSGPHVVVEWKGKHRPSFVPLHQIFFSTVENRDENLQGHADKTAMRKSPLMTRTSLCNQKTILSQQQQKLIRGLESSGKSIGNAEQIFGTAELSAFWVEDEIWYDATPINIGCQDDTIRTKSKKSQSENLLTSHFEYTLPGIYCPIEYEDGVRQLIPVSYIFRRGCYPRQKEDEDSDNSNSSDIDSISPPGTTKCKWFCGGLYGLWKKSAGKTSER